MQASRWRYLSHGLPNVSAYSVTIYIYLFSYLFAVYIAALPLTENIPYLWMSGWQVNYRGCGKKQAWSSVRHYLDIYLERGGTRKSSWLTHYTTSLKVAGSIPYVVIRFLNWSKSSSPTNALGSTQPLTEMSTRNLSGGWRAAGV
jgi:hypothetical protein